MHASDLLILSLVSSDVNCQVMQECSSCLKLIALEYEKSTTKVTHKASDMRYSTLNLGILLVRMPENATARKSQGNKDRERESSMLCRFGT